MDYETLKSQALEFAAKKKGKRGFLQELGPAVMGFVGLIVGAFLLMVFLYVGQTLNTSLNNNQVGVAWTNVVTATTNFTSQLGSVGTIAGVLLIVAVIGGIGLYAYGAVKGRGGTGM